MKLDKANYEKYIKGYFLIDCVVRKKNILYFIFEQERDEEKNDPPKNKVMTKVVSGIDHPGIQPWGHIALRGMHYLKAGVSYQPKEQFVGVSLNDHVYVLGSGVDELEKDLSPSWFESPGKGMRGGVTKLRTIDGYVYGCAGGRTVVRRNGKNDWDIYVDMPFEDKGHEGFRDIDGFAANDIYAVGGKGDVWHFDGKKWKQIPFPSNMDLWSICCAGDGNVYIGAQQGCLFKGRGDKWKRVHQDSMALPFRDLVWHQNKLWCTSDYGLWILEKDKLTSAEQAGVPAKVRACSGNLSVGDGVMLLAGMYGAALHDGSDWKMIIDYSDLS